LIADVKFRNPNIKDFDCSCFDGKYVTGDITEAYLAKIESARADGKKGQKPANSITQLDLNLINSNELQVEESA